jgi:phosphoribosylformimino-5-aminoimidazole carboxamide ribotide isomerase
MIEIIPAIDLIDGKCVRLSQGDFDRKKIYNENPLAVAKEFEGAGIKRLHTVDLDGAKNGKVTNLKVLETIAANTNLAIDFGGGIKTDADVQSVFDAGRTNGEHRQRRRRRTGKVFRLARPLRKRKISARRGC